jgi:hypothetical protein
MDAIRSLESYTLKVNPERVKEDFTQKKARMLTYLQTAFNALAAMQNQVMAVLAGYDLSTTDYPKYRAFASSVWKLQQKFGGGVGMINEVALQVAKWKARGCTEAVLNRIRDDVFNIPAPTP